MEILFKLLKPDGTDAEMTLPGLAEDTTLEDVRTRLGSFISETDFFVFANGTQVSKVSESSIEVSFNMIDDRTPNQIRLKSSALNIVFKLLKSDGTDSQMALSGLAQDTTLADIRTKLGSFIDRSFFVYANGIQVSKSSESELDLRAKLFDERTPNQILLSQAADIVGVQTEWIDDGGLSVSVKLNVHNPEAIQQNAGKSPAILLKKVNEFSPNIADIVNAIVLESGSAIEISVASKGTFGFVLKGSDGAESLFHTYGLNPDGDGTEKFVTLDTYLNVDDEMKIKKDLIVIEDGKSEALHMSGREIGKRWEISIKVWELEGYQTYDHDTNETVNYGSI